ncbi:diiron oxygenase [Sorangium sp. So ce406]|uniref:diiron oxygenase n=1 Tax=Sorangium sp. So ce406 TaxID=3133311 RepID=UPI003F5BBEC7
MHQANATLAPYRKPLSGWDAASWIRSKPIRSASCEGLAFPPELVPLSRHPRFVDDRASMERLLAYRLLTHLQFTTMLELEHVNAVCSRLARDCYALELSREQKNDALRIYCDEGAHALFVELLSVTIENRHGVERAALPQPRFHAVLERIFERHGGEVAPELLHLFFVSVSETLVSKILREIPRHPAVAPLVREVIGDHAQDEGTHSVYFHWLFPRAWSRLDRPKQELVGRILPRFLDAFLAPDLGCDARVLEALSFDEPTREEMLEETYQPGPVRGAVRSAAQPTLRMFEAAGVFETAAAADAFAEYDLYLENAQ